MKTLQEFLNESIVAENVNKDREACLNVLATKFGIKTDQYGVTDDGCNVFAYKFPGKDKCIIVDYMMLSLPRGAKGFIFMNANPNSQDKIWKIHDVPAFKEWVDENLGKAKFMWNSTPSESRLYGQMLNFYGVTIEVSELEKQSFCDVIKK